MPDLDSGDPRWQTMRKYLDVTSWAKAETLNRDIEDGVKPEGITIADALDKFIADCKARNLNRSTFGKYGRLVKALKQFADDHGYRLLAELSTDILRNSLTCGPARMQDKV